MRFAPDGALCEREILGNLFKWKNNDDRVQY